MTHARLYIATGVTYVSRRLCSKRRSKWDAELKDEDMARIVTWLDCNSTFYGAYRETERQARGEFVEPSLR